VAISGGDSLITIISHDSIADLYFVDKLVNLSSKLALPSAVKDTWNLLQSQINRYVQ